MAETGAEGRAAFWAVPAESQATRAILTSDLDSLFEAIHREKEMSGDIKEVIYIAIVLIAKLRASLEQAMLRADRAENRASHCN